MESQQSFFDFAAEVGLTKHFGGIKGTEDLAKLCRIGKGKYVLDVGCGAGVTSCFFAKRYRCRVVGVDIRERMIERSEERATREGVLESVEFRVADVQDLPFEDDLFDAVISESVTSFPQDKQRAVNEYARVIKPGGYVGLNESTLLKAPPPPDLVAWASQDLGATVQLVTSAEWVELMENAGLREITMKIHPVSPQNEAKGLLRRYGLVDMLRIALRGFRLYSSNRAYREFVKNVREEGIVPKNLDEYFGYGTYVGRK